MYLLNEANAWLKASVWTLPQYSVGTYSDLENATTDGHEKYAGIPAAEKR